MYLTVRWVKPHIRIRPDTLTPEMVVDRVAPCLTRFSILCRLLPKKRGANGNPGHADHRRGLSLRSKRGLEGMARRPPGLARDRRSRPQISRGARMEAPHGRWRRLRQVGSQGRTPLCG